MDTFADWKLSMSLRQAPVMMQVTYFKLSGGEHVFRMTPVHPTI